MRTYAPSHGWPVFEDGMALLATHFQQLVRSAEALSQSPLSGTEGSGFLSLQIDDRLQQGTLGIASCSAVFPDGSWVRIPEGDPCAPLEHIAQELSGVEFADVWLTTATRDAPWQHDAGTDSGRFVTEESDIADDYDRERERDRLKLLRRRLSLHLTHGRKRLPENRQALFVGRLEYSPNGHYILSRRAVPPCLSLQPILDSQATHFRAFAELIQSVVDRVGSSLQGMQADVQTVQQKPGVSAVDTVYLHDLLRLRSLATGYAMLTHCLNQRCHPASLYREMLRLNEDLRILSTLSLDRLPAYKHLDLLGCFEPLCRQLHQILDQRGARDHVKLLPISAPSEKPLRVWRFENLGELFLKKGRLFLVFTFRGKVSRAEACQLLGSSTHLKVGSVGSVKKLWGTAMESGLETKVRDPLARSADGSTNDLPKRFKALSWFMAGDAIYVEVANLTLRPELARTEFHKSAWPQIIESHQLEVGLKLDREMPEDEIRLDHLLMTVTPAE